MAGDTLKQARRISTGQALLQDIRTQGGYSLLQVSHNTNIPLKNLLRLENGETKVLNSGTWNKLLYFYCHITWKF